MVKLIDNYRANGNIEPDIVKKLTTVLHLTPEQVLSIFKALSTQIVLPDAALNEFAYVASAYIDTAARIGAMEASDSNRQHAELALRTGDIAGASRLLRKTDTLRETPNEPVKNDDIFDYPPGAITKIFSDEECQFWDLRPRFPGGFPAHTCDIQLNKIYAFVGNSGNDQPGFKFDLPDGTRTIYVHYQYVRGPLRSQLPPGPVPEKDSCTPNVYWETYYSNGYGDSGGGEDLDSCNFVYKISFKYNTQGPPPIGYMVSIRDFIHKIGTSKPYFGGNFVFAITE